MKSQEIRQTFLSFFESKGVHTKPSSSLIPKGDPTLLFTSAGMVQFKANFLGIDKSIKSAATCQKCVRTTDIDNVGFTNRHLTFFEMLGNFSFGDYFKKEAIEWSWEFLTKHIGLEPEKLYVSIYKGGIAERDAEAYNIWKNIVKTHITELSEKDNFWTMGPTGPCGPCSEIYYDFGAKDDKHDCIGIECECGRYVEIWNLVFTQFDRKEDGSIVPLPSKNIDTGMGLERLCMAVQNAGSPFETDLFTPIIEEAKNILSISGKEEIEKTTLRIIADHIRSSSLLIAEGVLPSNEGRGYILRRLIRRAVRYGRLCGAQDTFMYKLTAKVREIFGGVYPELVKNADYITKVLKTEEEMFLKTLITGEKELDSLLNKKNKGISGEEAFNLYETFGFPFELTKEIALLKGIKVDETGFIKAQEEAKEKSRSYASEMSKEKTAMLQKIESLLKNAFVGYDCLSNETQVLAVLNESYEEVSELSGKDGYLVLAETPFYAESGGQVGDRGIIKNESFNAEVVDTQKAISHLTLHKVKVSGQVKTGDKVFTQVDELSRKKTMANHTAVHLVNAALAKVFGKGVHQAGSFVSPEMFRFDYTISSAPKAEEMEKVFETANEAVRNSLKVTCEVRPLADVEKLGATVLIGENYADPARFLIVGNGGFERPADKYSLELCGGTHVGNTAEVLFILLIKESALSAGVRRIEGVAGLSALDYLKKNNWKIGKIAKALSTPIDKVADRVEALIEEVRQQKKEIEKLKSQLLSGAGAAKSNEEHLASGVTLITLNAEGTEAKDLRTLADNLSHGKKNTIILAGSVKDGKTSFVIKKAADTPSLKAGDIAGKLASAIGGRAGGREDFAQGGAETDDFESLITQIKKII
ncbi:alanyl-tRNA synthetase [Parelusimicrobium proximum]|uniref:alanine--tRNA ligase n=1 Tax=Parelusimicrobium proximum TaxID=3228953 RepID=UPI003D16AD0D